MFAGIPGTCYIEGEAIWITTEDGALGTQMLRSNFPNETVDQHIDAVIVEVGQYTAEFD